ncbi:MAG: serine kinase, partial [Alphaproteobacteria bacterium]|nr:serine kinase [Alphaproteobacteria bacterium]
MQVHASCIAFEGRGVLLRGPSGSGKSDLALRAVEAG